jgi:hypothetical protein
MYSRLLFDLHWLCHLGSCKYTHRETRRKENERLLLLLGIVLPLQLAPIVRDPLIGRTFIP